MVIGILPVLEQVAECVENGNLHRLSDIAELRIGIARGADLAGIDVGPLVSGQPCDIRAEIAGCGEEAADHSVLIRRIHPEVHLGFIKRNQCHAAASFLSSVAGSGSAFLLQDFDRLGQDSLAVQTLGGKESDLTVTGEQLVQALEGDALTVADPVVAQVTEDDGFGTGSSFRHIRGSEVGPAKDRGHIAVTEGRLPQVLAVVVLQLADELDGRIIQDPDGILAVRGLEAEIQVNQLIGGNGSRAGRSDTDLAATRGVEDAGRLGGAVAGEEGFFLLVADAAGKLGRDIALQIKGGIVQELLGDLDDGPTLWASSCT